jgi:hypothetical protein
MLNSPDTDEDRKRRQEAERLAVAARLKEIIGTLPGQVGQTKVATICDVKPQAITGWLKTGRIAKRHLPVIAKEAKCNLAWLITGEGPKDLCKNQPLAIYPSVQPATPRNISGLLDADLPDGLPATGGSGEADDGGLYERLNIHSQEPPDLAQMLDGLSARLDKASPAIREDASRLMLRYLDEPGSRGRLIRAIEQLLAADADPAA